ncbi:hypothetical protein PR002_g1106 [Phytophthora rubi]|uniref:Uncharacterized protein n=2 Tax=Phytophthora rubi TaxID=129364 RepID=A0A6A3P2A6_9STRA|nr:hypothetical protein PR002_g1106 [Phytophthora rubi]
MRIENALERQLIVADEQLSSLEDMVRVMPNAQYLSVAFNNICSLGGVEQLKELRSLDISHNTVESLQEVAALSNLLVLKCSSNQIADLSWIAGLNDLEELWVRDNRLESAQLAHLQQLTVLQTLVIHPNPCTERDDYVLTILKVLPWLQRVDTVIVTDELREEARHAEERGALDSGATNCSLFSLSGRAEDPASNDDSPEMSVDTPPSLPIKPPKSKKQLTAEEIMRAFPVQEFIPVSDGVESATVEDDQSLELRSESFQTLASNSTTTVQEDSRNELSPPLKVSEAIPQQITATPAAKPDIEDGGISALLSSVLTLPTFDNESFLKKKKPQSQLSGNGKSKLRAKPKPIAEATLPFHQDEEYSIAYPNSTVTAVQVRCDGSAIARWPSGSVAVSVDFENTAERSGYRVYAAHKDGQLALSFDPAGVGFLNAYPSGKTLLSTTSQGDGLLFDTNNGAILRQWNAQGNLRDGSCQSASCLGGEPDGSLLCQLSEHLAVRVQLARSPPAQLESAGDTKQEGQTQRNPISLHIYFSGAPGIRHVFVNSANQAERSDKDESGKVFGKASPNRDVARATKAKPPPIAHVDLLSSIRAAVAGL